METTTIAELADPRRTLPGSLAADAPQRARERATPPSRVATLPPWRVAYELGEARGLERPLAERFIAQCYRRNFRAHVDAFMPRLFVLRDAEGAVRGALGLRAATSGRLFVERYLDEPVEDAILRLGPARAARDAIVEVGHFAGLMPGAMRLMIALLAQRLHREGTEWVTFAGTRALRNTFLRMNLVPTEVCAASPARLSPIERAAWGTYYVHAPSVYIGRVAVGVREIARERSTEGVSP